MKKILKILTQENKITLKNNLKLRTLCIEIRRSFLMFGIQIKLNTEADFFDALIQYQGLTNKRVFEDCFENERRKIIDLWDHLSYQEKNKLINVELNDLKNTLRYFKDKNGKVTWIPFFDELLNALYHHEIAIFELDQYFKLYKQFKDRRVHQHYYGWYPYQTQFIDITEVFENEDIKLFYYEPLKSLFKLDRSMKIERWPLDKTLCQIHPLKKDLLALANVIVSHQEEAIVKHILESMLFSDKTKRRIKLKYKKEFFLE